jgi:manganese/zinc/iron transport system permease protein
MGGKKMETEHKIGLAMVSEIYHILSQWSSLDWWIVATAALAAMACALPGNYLLLRRQSMMGDALSHTVLLGVVLAFLFAHWLKKSGWISADVYFATRHGAMFVGAMLMGIVSALLMEAVQKLGRVESSAAMGVVFTTLFAAGLLLIRVAADSVHIDPDCVLYGTIETVVMDTIGTTSIPKALVVNGAVFFLNTALVVLFYKELRVSTFDPNLATSLGINANLIHYGLMAVTAATLVAAFESVGSILVIAMLIVPAATARLLTDRLQRMIGLSLLMAAASAGLGHMLAITLPPVLFSRVGFPSVVDASSAGMMAAAGGMLFVVALLFGPRHGVVVQAVQDLLLSYRIACEDVLGSLYRVEERADAATSAAKSRTVSRLLGIPPLVAKLAVARLRLSGLVHGDAHGLRLTDAGRLAAETIVRSHRLWETYMEKHFPLADDHLHEAASRVEHFINPELRHKLAAELDTPQTDPHGRAIPSEARMTNGEIRMSKE